MILSISKVLKENYDNYIMPFFWQHGEEETVLREYMEVIYNCGIRAVCVESRPHPDFCGEKWWKDMNIILEEAKNRDMKVWILDDSHFPTGYANGAVENAPEELCRQGICYESKTISGGKKFNWNIERFLKKKNSKFSMFDLAAGVGKKKRVFSPDVILSVTAVRMDKVGEEIDLTSMVQNGKLIWKAPEGKWKVGACKLSRNCGAHRNYINMMNPESCKMLLDSVYEPHWQHYKEEFGKTIAGFFSDEPELGNGKMYSNEPLGSEQDLPWCFTLENKLRNVLGENWKNKMSYLWEWDLDSDETARVRYAYMDAVTEAVKKSFSEQVGNWCREHGVEYIGHVVEDNNNHGRTGGSLGHYFRGLSGQDMAGIDDIGGQVMPQGEDRPDTFMRFMKRDGEFYHYILGKLGPSLAAINPKMQGRTMCEIFGNYGWAEGLRLEKYLADHFMVNGVNRFVPHAFSAKEFPDPDCPPHFYAHGHNPQYRHFGSLMGYMNRVCSLIDGGRHVAPIGLLYHAEAEWTGKAMLMQKPARKLLDSQINFDILPTDVFTDREYYHTDLSGKFQVNTQKYRALVIPYAQYVSKQLISAIQELKKVGIPVIFLDEFPDGIYDKDGTIEISFALSECENVDLEGLVPLLQEKLIDEIQLNPENNRIRYLHYQKETDIYYFINEGTEIYKGSVMLPQKGSVYAYHAWENQIERVKYAESDNGTLVTMELEPYQSCILVFDEIEDEKIRTSLVEIEKEGKEILFEQEWTRSICESVAYPEFKDKKQVNLPDQLSQEMPKFSGWVCYENKIQLHRPECAVLTISDAYEGVEVFVNHVSVGVQVVPTYRFDITKLVKEGENEIRIEVSTTLERERAAAKNQSQIEKMMRNKVLAPTGIVGDVKLYVKE